MRTMLPLVSVITAASLLAVACDPAGGGNRMELDPRGEGPVRAPTTAVAEEAVRTPATVVGADEGELRWFMPTSGDELGDGAEVRVMIDRSTVPHASMEAIVQKTAASGILVHAHKWQAEIIYVIRGVGVGLVGDGREEISLEAGSLLYVPKGAWHGFRNTDPENRLEILLVTRPTIERGLADFFRSTTSRPGEPPLDLSMEELVSLLEEYGIEVPRN